MPAGSRPKLTARSALALAARPLLALTSDEARERRISAYLLPSPLTPRSFNPDGHQPGDWSKQSTMAATRVRVFPGFGDRRRGPGALADGRRGRQRPALDPPRAQPSGLWADRSGIEQVKRAGVQSYIDAQLRLPRAPARRSARRLLVQPLQRVRRQGPGAHLPDRVRARRHPAARARQVPRSARRDAKSPAMLFYLDNWQSAAPERATTDERGRSAARAAAMPNGRRLARRPGATCRRANQQPPQPRGAAA